MKPESCKKLSGNFSQKDTFLMSNCRDELFVISKEGGYFEVPFRMSRLVHKELQNDAAYFLWEELMRLSYKKWALRFDAEKFCTECGWDMNTFEQAASSLLQHGFMRTIDEHTQVFDPFVLWRLDLEDGKDEEQ